MNSLLAISQSDIFRAERDADGSWSVKKTLTGRDVRAVAVDPRRPFIAYAGTEEEGIFRSDDGGLTWRPAGLSGHKIRSIAISPHQPDLVYAGTKPVALYVTRDGGQSWNELPALREKRAFWWFSPAEPPGLTPYVMAIALSPTEPGVMLAGIELGAVLRSADGGETWSRHRRGSLRDCHSLIFHGSDGRWAYEGGGTGGGAAVSRDGGVTWEQLKAGRKRSYGWDVAADPERPEIWYVSASGQGSIRNGLAPMAHQYGKSNGAIYRMSGGGRWQQLSGGLPEPLDYMPYTLVTDPAAPGHIYTGLVNGDIWHSADYGDNWQQLPLNLGRLYRMMPLSAAPSAVNINGTGTAQKQPVTAP